MPSAKPDVQSIFGRATEIASPSERAAFLDAACADHPAVRAEVETLLKAIGNAGSFMGHPAAPVGETAAYKPIAEGPGSRVGPYKLLQEIGEGGMGTVFMAEQEEPVRRRVAVKIIRAGLDSKGVLARFEAERQALALMDHPNIARVLDAGTTDGGSPYFVMELVKGVPFTKFCDENQLSLRERLELFVPVCQAIQHAHMKGIIHRDIKPSNVLVALYDDKPVPKVIDFGVAKATSQKLTDKTLFTAFGAVVGTLEYMSPEQAKLNQLDIDTRSDVYALGVLLYELLTGSTPLDRARLKSAALDEVLRLIREEEPPRPSTRLSTAATLPQIAAARKSPADQLGKVLRGELDWIVMKSLEKDRTRRYDGAASLAKDVQRYLSGDAVEACPPTLGYRLKKAYRRNRTAVLIGGLIAAVLLAATGVSFAFGVMAKRAEADAVTARNGEAEQREEVGKQRDLAVKLGGEAAAERDNTKSALALAESERDRVRRLLYASQMSSASMAFAEGRSGQFLRLLDEAVPRPGEPDLRGWEWHFLDRQSRTDRQYTLDVEPPTQGFPMGVRFDTHSASRDGRWILARRAVEKGFVYVVTDAATGHRIGQVPKTEVLRSNSLVPVLSEDGRHLLVMEGRIGYPLESPLSDPSRKQVLRIWDVQAGTSIPAPADLLKKEVYLNQFSAALGANAAWLAWLEVTDPNPTQGVMRGLVVKGPVEHTVARWEAATGQVTRTKLTIGNGWGSARLSPDGRSVHWYPTDDRVASGLEVSGTNIEYDTGEYQVWDIAQPAKAKLTLRVSVGPSANIASPNWTMLAVKDRRMATVYDLTTGRVHWQTPLPVGYVDPGGGVFAGFRVSDDGNRLLFPSSELLTVLEKGRSGETVQRRITFRSVRTTDGRSSGGMYSFLPDGRTVTRRSENLVRVWDVSQDPIGLGAPTALGGRRLVTDDQGRSWFVMTTADGRRTVKWSAPPLSNDAGQAAPRHLFVLDGEGKELTKLELGPPATNEGRFADRILFVDSDRRLLLNTYRPKDARPGVTYLSVPPGSARRLDFTLEWALYDLEKPGFERVAGGSGSLYATANPSYLSWFNTPTPGSFIGNILGSAVGRDQQPLTLYEARTGKVAREFRPPSGVRFLVTNLIRMIDPTGGRVVMLATKRAERTEVGSVQVEVCDIASGKQVWLAELPDVQFAVQGVGIAREGFRMAARFTPDGNRVIVVYLTKEGMQLGVWSAATGQHERTLNLTSGPERTHEYSDLTVSSTGRHFALRLSARQGVRGDAAANEFLGVWNLDTGEHSQRITGLGDAFGLMAMSTDGTRLFATDTTPQPGTPGRLHVWDVMRGREVLSVPLDYDPNPYRTAPSGLRFDEGKLHLDHPLWVRTLDGTPLPEPKK